MSLKKKQKNKIKLLKILILSKIDIIKKKKIQEFRKFKNI